MPQWVGATYKCLTYPRSQHSQTNTFPSYCVMKDTTSLPFAAVINEWTSSMHDLEEGDLTWGDVTQWALNRLTASQVSLINSQSTAEKKPCCYFNEGSCSHDNHLSVEACLQLLLSAGVYIHSP